MTEEQLYEIRATVRELRAAVLALTAENRQLRLHAEALVEVWENQDSDSWERLSDVAAAYRADFPERLPEVRQQ